jgi:hypothetical protein
MVETRLYGDMHREYAGMQAIISLTVICTAYDDVGSFDRGHSKCAS